MPTETSVALSLAELSRIEEERVEREKTARAKGRSARIQREREAEARRLAEDDAKLRDEEAARVEQARREAAERALRAARERADLEVARIRAEAKSRLDADNAARAHELAVLGTKRETGRRRREIVLGVALSVCFALGGFGFWDASARTSKYERSVEELRERERAVLRERDDSKRVELQSLERRHATLLARPRTADAKPTLEAAESARAAIDVRSPSQDRLRAFADSLDVLDRRLDVLDEVALLDRRGRDLASWASSQKRTARLESVKTAALRAKAEDAGADAISAYERELDGVASELGERTRGAARPHAGEPTGAERTCREGDPGCGLDGKPLF
jgi:hypothetical protein